MYDFWSIKCWALWVCLLWIFSEKIDLCCFTLWHADNTISPTKMPSSNIFISEQLRSMKICCLLWCVIKTVSLQQGNVEKINVMIEPLPCFIYRLDALTQPNQILLRINAKTNFCFAVTHRMSNYDWCWMIYQNMPVVQQADFEKIISEYDLAVWFCDASGRSLVWMAPANLRRT